MWGPTQKIIELPKEIQKEYVFEAKNRLTSLNNAQLKVELYDAPEPKHVSHKIRRAQEHNPDWYSELFQAYAHITTYRSSQTNRKRTCLVSKINRQKTSIALERIISLQEKNTFHEYVLREQIHTHFIKGFIGNTSWIPANDYVREFFGLQPLYANAYQKTDNRKITQKQPYEDPFPKNAYPNECCLPDDFFTTI
ncbi:MAG: hypothetical protein ACOCQQ_01915 [Candidatus Nanoarchaeia archaeon]